jgi:hypothetical protein
MLDLLLSARADPEAFGEFYRRHAIGVERWLRTQTPGLATAADLTAETFAQALVSLDRFRASSDEQPWHGSSVSRATSGAGFIDQANIPAGSRGVLAVYRSPSGGIDLTIATRLGASRPA